MTSRAVLGLPIAVSVLALLTGCAGKQLKLEMERQVVVTPPKIQSLDAQPSGEVNTSGRDQTVKVILRGDPGLSGTVQATVGQEVQNVLLTETQPGQYEGSFPVRQGQTGAVDLVGRLRHEPTGAQQQINQGGLVQLVSRPGTGESVAAAEAAPAPLPPLEAPSGDGCTGEAGKRLEARLQALTVHFDFNKATVRTDATQSLESVAQALRGGDCRVLLAGHTDEVGSEAYNQDLSEMRAKAVRAYLADRLGIPASRLEATGYGETRLLDTSGSDEARQKNRRVEIQLAPPR